MKTKLTLDDKSVKLISMITTVVVQSAMKNLQVEKLSNIQQKEIEPVVRNAVYSALKLCLGELTEAEDMFRDNLYLTSLRLSKHWEELEFNEEIKDGISIYQNLIEQRNALLKKHQNK